VSHDMVRIARDSRLPCSGRRCNDMSGLAAARTESVKRLRYAKDC